MFLYLVKINFLLNMENEYKIIEYSGNKVVILKFISESITEFDQRLCYIKKLENNNISWKEAKELSLLWYSIKFKKCKYNNYLGMERIFLFKYLGCKRFWLELIIKKSWIKHPLNYFS